MSILGDSGMSGLHMQEEQYAMIWQSETAGLYRSSWLVQTGASQ